MYLTGSGFNGSPGEIFRSWDNGNTITQLSGFANPTIPIFLKIALTEADTNYILAKYNQLGNNTIALSTNGGLTFNIPNNSIPLEVGQGEIAISYLNKNRFYTGFPPVYKSNNAGVNWFLPGYGWHVDTRGLKHSPFNKRYIYFCNDGGIYKLDDSTDAITNLSNTLCITTFYTLDVSESDTVRLLGGALDNGNRYKRNNGIWSKPNGADGFDCFMHNTNGSISFTSSQKGVLYRTFNDWQTQTNFGLSQLATFGTILRPNPQNNNSLYTTYHDVYKSTELGDNWQPLSSFNTVPFSYKLDLFDVSKKDSLVMVTAYTSYDKYYYTSNEGLTWQNMFPPAFSFYGSDISSLTVHDNNTSTIIATYNGYLDTVKVFVSSDKGLTWQNITYNLPNVPIYCFVMDAFSDTLHPTYYIGTSVGVYSKKENSNQWSYYGNGLPNSFVTALKIRKSNRKIVAATLGRSIWEADLPLLSPSSINETSPAVVTYYPNPCDNELSIQIGNTNSKTYQISIMNLQGQTLYKRLFNPTTVHIKIPTYNWPNGIYFVEVNNGTSSIKDKLLIRH